MLTSMVSGLTSSPTHPSALLATCTIEISIGRLVNFRLTGSQCRPLSSEHQSGEASLHAQCSSVQRMEALHPCAQVVQRTSIVMLLYLLFK